MARNVTVIPASRTTIKANKPVSGERIRVAAYCRVSTDMEEQLHSFANQMDYYTKYISSKPEYEMVGVYGDEGISGTSLKKRDEFKRMIEDCKAGKIDLVITKSISRFARNTQDCLKYARALKNMGIGVYFEKENINTLDASGELLFTILSSLAQEESRNISENCKWGIRSKFKKGISHMNATCIMGYRQAEDGSMEIDPEQAEIVRRVYREFLEGMTPPAIAKRLNEEGIKGVKGKVSWHASIVFGMLQNEKFKGDSLLQKTYTVDFLEKKTAKNTGQIEQYYVTGSHPAIIDDETWEAVQLEIKRRDQYMRGHGLTKYGYAGCSSPYVSKVFCGECGCSFQRHVWSGRGVCIWQCKDSIHAKGGICKARRVEERVLDRAFVIAWNSIVQERDKYMPEWEKQIQEGDPLSHIRAKQMIDLTAEGKIVKQVPELAQMVLESFTINEKTISITFLSGNIKEIAV